MPEGSEFEAALARFDAAMKGFETAVARARDTGQRHDHDRRQAESLRHDRARLAEEVERLKARIGTLTAANGEVSTRLDAAMRNIRTILEGDQGHSD